MQIVKKYFLGFFLLFLVVLASFLIYQKLHPKTLPPNLIEGVGSIDGDLININVKYAGRVKDIKIDDGDSIKKGDTLAILSSKEIEAKKSALIAEIKAKNRELEAKKTQLLLLKETLPKNVSKANENLKAKEAALKEISNAIDTLKRVVLQDERDLKRIKNLYEKRLVNKHKVEEAELKLINDKNRLKSLNDKRYQAKAALKAAKEDLSQAKATLKRIDALNFSVLALKDAIEALRAKEAEIEAVLSEMEIRSPIDGFIVEKIANIGEVLAPGSIVATAIDPRTLYLKIFVDTINNGKIKIGDKAVIFLDAYPNMPIEAKVVRIAQKAEFTPKEVAVREDRIQRVYAIHLKPLKPNPLLKLGIPAIGVVSIDGRSLPKSLKEIPLL